MSREEGGGMHGTTVQVLGEDYVSRLGLQLERDFSVVSRISGVSPFTIAAPNNGRLMQPDGDEKSTARSRLDHGKTLAAALRGARADLLVVDLTGASRPIVELEGEWYTPAPAEDSWLARRITAEVERGRAIPLALRALSENELERFDVFAEVVRDAYGPGRIVLVGSAVAEFFWDGEQVRPRARVAELRAHRERLAALETRFVELTGCDRIDLAGEFLPRADGPPEDLRLGADFSAALERELVAAVRAAGPRDTTASRARRSGSSGFAEWAHRQLIRGRPIREGAVRRRISAQGSLAHSDAVALAALVGAHPEGEWLDVAKLVCALPNSAPVAAARRRFDRNVETLRTYPHVYVDGSTELRFEPHGSVRLADDVRLVIDPSAPRPLLIEQVTRTGDWDAGRFVDRGYSLQLHELDNVLESWWMYFERARRGDTQPFRLEFADRAAFARSLSAVDYAEVLENERLCLTVEGRLPEEVEWAPAVDLGFLFDPSVRVCGLRSGFGDQLYYYVHARALSTKHGLRLYLDDLLYDNDEMIAHTPHIRPDVLPFIEADGVFSELISRRLRAARVRDLKERRDNRSEYHRMGLREMVLATDRMHLKACYDRREYPSALTVQVIDLDGYERLMIDPPGVLYLDVLAKHELLAYRLLEQKSAWERAIRLPPFESEASKGVEAKMLETDAVVVHIRRGDRVALGIADRDAYYRDFVLRTSELDHLPNKHWFVFSDDLDYCRSHREELGLDIARDRITFVEGNHHYASIDDFHLMALGKVVVCGKSGFSASAAMISTRVEHIFGTGYSLTPGGDSWSRAEQAQAASA